MFSYLLFFVFLKMCTKTVISDAQVIIMGPTNVRATLDPFFLNCTLQKIGASQSFYQMSIMKGREVLAKIDEDGKTTTSKKYSDIEVSGLKDGSAGKVYLNLTASPRNALSSKYFCDATIFDEQGHKKIKSNVIQVTVKVPNELEINSFLGKKIRELEKFLTNLNLTLNHIQITMNQDQSTLKNIREQDEQILKNIKSTMAEKKDLENLKSTIVDKQEFYELKSKLDSFISKGSSQSSGALRIEKGSISCDSNLYQKYKNWRYKVINVTFSTPFSKTPRIAVGLRAVDVEGPVRLYGKDVSVTQYGFVFHCYTWDNTVYRWNLFDWIAFE